jgi:hypothetical protein
MLLRLQVANLRRRLFALFAHPAAGVFETVALIMRTIAEEDGVAAEPMRDAALKDGALLRHLVSSGSSLETSQFFPFLQILSDSFFLFVLHSYYLVGLPASAFMTFHLGFGVFVSRPSTFIF